jgi:hypothetical protein
MKIIDHTPFVSEKGEISPVDQVKAAMKYGLSWAAEVKSQQAVMTRLEKPLERGFTLIRNQPLGQAGITLPLVLVGPPGIFVIHATELRGMYRAKGDAWGTLDGTRFTPARVNLLTRTTRLARALQVFLERQGLSSFGTVEPVIMAADPGLHVESVRPVVRVVLNDAIERFAASLTQARPVMSAEIVHEVVERIQHPLPPKSAQPAAAPVPEPHESSMPAFLADDLADDNEAETPIYQPMGQEMAFSEQPSEDADINASELGFAFDEEPAAAAAFRPPPPPPVSLVPSKAQSAKRRRLFSPLQWAILAAMALATLCILCLLGYYIISSQ